MNRLTSYVRPNHGEDRVVFVALGGVVWPRLWVVYTAAMRLTTYQRILVGVVEEDSCLLGGGGGHVAAGCGGGGGAG